MSANNKFIEIATKEICRDIQHVDQTFQRIIDEGGEGIILRDPACASQSGRSTGYLKHKVIILYNFPPPQHVNHTSSEIQRCRSSGCQKSGIASMGMRIVRSFLAIFINLIILQAKRCNIYGRARDSRVCKNTPSTAGRHRQLQASWFPPWKQKTQVSYTLQDTKRR